MSRWINRRPERRWRVVLGLLPFVLLLALYQWGSAVRKADNPQDKLLPSLVEMGTAVERMALTPSVRTGEYLFWQDTAASLKRLLTGVALAALIGLVLGLLTGSIPLLGAQFDPLITFIALVPPLALLPILFIVLGLGEVSKVALIVIGIAPFIVRDVAQRSREIPAEQLVKAQTLGGNSGQIVLRVVLPQVMPRLIDAVRLSLGAAWLFLIAAEAIASSEGLGYRIFLVRRYLSMDVILPYVAWITLLAYLLDSGLSLLSRRLFPWHHGVRT